MASCLCEDEVLVNAYIFINLTLWRMQMNKSNSKKKKTIIEKIYFITLFFLTLTGFGQMPIFKRYYIADIPGLEWLAKFYITHYMHMIFSVFFIAMLFYFATNFFLSVQKKMKLTSSGIVRIFILSGILVSGVLLVIKNFPNSNFHGKFITNELIIGLDLFHLGFVMLFLITAFVCKILNRHYLENRGV